MYTMISAYSGRRGDHYTGADRTYSLDVMPQEYSPCGVGDFRLPSIELELPTRCLQGKWSYGFSGCIGHKKGMFREKEQRIIPLTEQKTGGAKTPPHSMSFGPRAARRGRHFEE